MEKTLKTLAKVLLLLLSVAAAIAAIVLLLDRLTGFLGQPRSTEKEPLSFEEEDYSDSYIPYAGKRSRDTSWATEDDSPHHSSRETSDTRRYLHLTFSRD